jgi:hypothetical protein
MTDSINVNNSFIAFPFQVEHQLGQKVLAGKDIGYIIGIKLGRFGWDYLVIVGNPPNDDSEEIWFHNQQLAPYNY